MKEPDGQEGFQKSISPKYMHILYEFDEYAVHNAGLIGEICPLPTKKSMLRWIDKHGKNYNNVPTLKNVLTAYIYAKLMSMGIEYKGMALFKKGNSRVYASKGEKNIPTWKKGAKYTLFVDMGWLCKRSIPPDIRVVEADAIFKIERLRARTIYHGDAAEKMRTLIGEADEKGKILHTRR